MLLFRILENHILFIIGASERCIYIINWNDDGRFGPERYIEAHIWSDETIQKCIK